MKTYKYTILTLGFLFAVLNLYPATLIFQCKDVQTNEIIPIEIVDVIVENKNRSKSLPADPFQNQITLFAGKNYVHVWGNGYIRLIDSIFVEKDIEVIEKEFFLEKAIIESTPEIENYQAKLERYTEPDSLLRIGIDSTSIINNQIFAFVTFENISPISIYILKSQGCIEPIQGIIYDENKHLIGNHGIRIDCVGEKIYPDSNDLILINGNSQISYPKYHVYRYDMSKLPPGNYYLKIMYEYIKPEYFSNGTYRKDYRVTMRDKILTINKTLRGRFESYNTVLLKIK